MLQHRRVLQRLRELAASVLRENIEQPQQQRNSENQNRGNNLILRERREKRAQRQQHPAQQQHAQIASRNHPPRRRGVRMSKHEDHVKHRRQQHDHQQRERRQKLSYHDLRIRNRRSHQQFHRPALALLVINSHRQHRRQKQNDRPQQPQKSPQNHARHIHVERASAHLHALHSCFVRIANHLAQNVVEENSAQHQENAHHHIRHRRNKIVAHLLAIDRVQAAHQFASSAFSVCLCAGSSVVSCKKISSRLTLSPRSSYSGQPCPTIFAAIWLRRSAPCPASTSAIIRPPEPSDSTCTFCAPGIFCSASRNCCSGACASTRMRSPPLSCRVRFSGVSTATIFPLLMIITRSHVMLTSGKMCVDNMIV